MTAQGIFAAALVLLEWTAILSVLTVSVLNVVVQRSRIGVTVALCWVLLGTIFLVVLPARWHEEARVFVYALFTYVAFRHVRDLTGAKTRGQPYAANRRFARAVFGRRIADGLFAPVDRTLAREREARERGITLIDVLKEEHSRRGR